jgi:hypothetical protein
MASGEDMNETVLSPPVGELLDLAETTGDDWQAVIRANLVVDGGMSSVSRW